VEYRDGQPETVRLTWEQFEQQGWERAASTIRHELIHVHLLNEGVGAGHGEAFEQLASELDTQVHCERFAEPNWWVTCTDCENRMGRYRRSKLVTNPENYHCGNCGGRLQVEANES